MNTYLHGLVFWEVQRDCKAAEKKVQSGFVSFHCASGLQRTFQMEMSLLLLCNCCTLPHTAFISVQCFTESLAKHSFLADIMQPHMCCVGELWLWEGTQGQELGAGWVPEATAPRLWCGGWHWEPAAVVCLTWETTEPCPPSKLLAHFESGEKMQPSELLPHAGGGEGRAGRAAVAAVNGAICLPDDGVIKSFRVLCFLCPYLYFTKM